MRFLVRVLRRADREVEAILHFIAEERKAPEGARRWYRAYETALQRLAKEANNLPFAPENEFVDYEVRQTLFRTRKGRTYRGLFTIVGDEVRLLHVRGPGQNLMTEEELGRPNGG
jgi:plasmid stabilization system protein ParE